MYIAKVQACHNDNIKIIVNETEDKKKYRDIFIELDIHLSPFISSVMARLFELRGEGAALKRFFGSAELSYFRTE